jgi:small-conductance mechanosensitive channel
MHAVAVLANVTTTGETVIPTPAFLPDWVRVWMLELAAAVLVVVLAWLAARLATRLFSRPIAQYVDRQSLGRVALGSVRAGIYVLGLLTLLRIYGLDLGSIALSVTVFSAVVGVILAPIVGSFISGVFLLADQPYEIGDMIEFPERETRGYVEDITLRYTKVFTLDNTFLVIPNGEMRSRDVVNHSAEDTRVRLSLEVMVTYESDIAEARTRMEESARGVEGVITGGPTIRIGAARYPAGPQCLIASFADSGILLRMRYWASEPYRVQTLSSQVRTRVWESFDDDAVEIAYPHSQLMFDETSGELRVSANGELGGPGGEPTAANGQPSGTDPAGRSTSTDGEGGDTDRP